MSNQHIQYLPAGREGLSWWMRPLFKRLSRIEHGVLRVAVPGAQRSFGGNEGKRAEIQIHRPGRLLTNVLTKGDIGFAEAYFKGDWDSPNLVELLGLLAANEANLVPRSNPGLQGLGVWLDRWRHWRNRNTRNGSRRNIAAHYDLGNDFYQAWLDPSLTYSSGIFRHAGESLVSAQANKYQRILDLLGGRAGERVLEIGCGWGGFALAAAGQGLRVDGLTLSQEQLRCATQRAQQAGLDDRIQHRLLDYRDVQGCYDHIVSIEMFEAVGEAYWPGYMRKLKQCLAPAGKAMLQVITIDEAKFEQYRSKPDFIQRYIFPGGMLPSRERLLQVAAEAGMRATDIASFGLDYAETLRIWRERFERNWDYLRSLGFDERFRRLWRYYLAYCEAGFRLGRIDLVQVRLEHER